MPVKVVCAVIRKGFRVFCVQKGGTKYPYTSYKWEFPGGKVEEGEIQQRALRRELKEELNYDVKVEGRVTSVNYAYPDFEIDLHAWQCTPVKNATYTLNEHVDAHWVPLWKLKKMDFAAADKVIIRKMRRKHLIASLLIAVCYSFIFVYYLFYFFSGWLLAGTLLWFILLVVLNYLYM